MTTIKAKYQLLPSEDTLEGVSMQLSALRITEPNSSYSNVVLNLYDKDDVIVVHKDHVGLVNKNGCIIYNGTAYSSVSAFVLAANNSTAKTVSGNVRNMVRFKYKGYTSTWGAPDIQKVRNAKNSTGNNLKKIYEHMKKQDMVPLPSTKQKPVNKDHVD